MSPRVPLTEISDEELERLIDQRENELAVEARRLARAIGGGGGRLGIALDLYDIAIEERVRRAGERDVDARAAGNAILYGALTQRAGAAP